MQTEDLSQKLAVVTGASRGIGAFIAAALHRAGAAVAVTGRHERTLNESAKQIGERCKPFVCNHADPSSIESAANAILEDMGTPDILVNNAAAMRGGPVAELTLDAWNEVIGTNLTGVFLTTRAFLPAMLKEERGDIFMISSMSGKKGDFGGAAYAASKFGLQGFSQALNYEVRKHNIRVMVLNPSGVDKTSKGERRHGPGLKLHAQDIADTIVHIACLPGRTLIRDMDIWGTNPP